MYEYDRYKYLEGVANDIFGPDAVLDRFKKNLPQENAEEWLYAPKKNINDYKHADGSYHFATYADTDHSWYMEKDGIKYPILQMSPVEKYGCGVLAPLPMLNQAFAPSLSEQDNIDSDFEDDESSEIIMKKVDNLGSYINRSDNFDSNDNENIPYTKNSENNDTTKKGYLSSETMIGASILVDEEIHDISYIIKGARYEVVHINIIEGGRKRHWWVRRPVDEAVKFEAEEISVLKDKGRLAKDILLFTNKEGSKESKIELRLALTWRSHPHINANKKILTTVLQNISTGSTMTDDKFFFQTRLVVKVPSGISPYPGATLFGADEEQKSLKLLYGRKMNFGIGHNCSVTWDEQQVTQSDSISEIVADTFPMYEVHSFTPELENISLPIKAWAGINIAESSYLWDREGLCAPMSNCEKDPLDAMIKDYSAWVENLKKHKVPEELQETKERHYENALEMCERMKEGISLLESSEDLRICFRLAHRAMLWQSISITLPASGKVDIDPDQTALKSERCWRPFQLAFLLANLKGLTEGDDTRNTVDLIWFPTGGGKTEAYLACAALSILYRRLQNPKDSGTDVILRYTLRLLTIQQFQRASSLIVALDTIRKNCIEKNEQKSERIRLGDEPISIGLWVGSSNTPNTRDDAKSKIKDLLKDKVPSYSFVMQNCPWCGKKLVDLNKDKIDRIPGLRPGARNTYEGFRCPKTQCNFHDGIPVEVVDDILYERVPTFLVSTVDKLASIPFKPESHVFFGKNGNLSPGLIIQDELHLISGPLGSAVGLFETFVEAACSREQNRPVKYITSTATTRCASQQVASLFNRQKCSIFPPPGICATDSFFAKENRQKPGRLYVGIYPRNFYSGLRSSRELFASTLIHKNAIPSEARKNPLWTNLIFFNSIRELSNNLSLFAREVNDYARNLKKQYFSTNFNFKRINPHEIQELTSRLDSTALPGMLKKLEQPYKDQNNEKIANSNKYPSPTIGACLASNIIEVGVDIDRLSLMTVICQPKSTAQYIQVTGRVGRKYPGIVLVNYMTSRNRDTSCYEQFQSYHASMYAQVEPASVTPFAHNLLKRSLMATIIAWIRFTDNENSTDDNSIVRYDDKNLEKIISIIQIKAQKNNLTKQQMETLNQQIDKAKELLQQAKKQNLIWGSMDGGDTTDFMRPAGSVDIDENFSVSVPTSMRNVDANVLLRPL